ncbi:MAG: type IV pilus assembly protein PilW [Colwellia sp.]|jgi:type IV pilus assembly protein PilW
MMMVNAQRGFSLIEIFISLAVGLMLLLGILSIFVGMKTTTVETTSYGELQENGRYAISLLSDDLLRQGFWGDLSGSLDVSGLVSSPLPTTVAGDCIGEGVNNASFPAAIGHFRTLWGKTVNNATLMGCITNAKIGSDVLQLKRAVSSTTALADISSDDYYIISNSNTAGIFAGGAAVPSVNFGQIWEYQQHIYYIREDSQGTNNVPVLVQGRLQNKALVMNLDMVVEGIEYIRFMYGVDTTNNGVVNAFISADNMANSYWDNESDVRILAVKIFVLARNILPDRDYENLNSYQLGDLNIDFIDGDGKGDNYRRLLFSSTITLYNARVDSWP